MSVFANPALARHVAYSEYLTLDPTVVARQLAKAVGGGWVVGSTAGWLGTIVDEYYPVEKWNAIPLAEQKKMMDEGLVVMITQN